MSPLGVEDLKVLPKTGSSPPSPVSSTEKVDAYDVDAKESVDYTPSGPRSLFVDGIRVHVDPSVPALAEGDFESKWRWTDLFLGRKQQDITDYNAIATRPSFYDDPNLAPHYTPIPEYENLHRFDPLARWTYAEEKKLVRKADLRVLLWIVFMFLALDIDRGNISQANSSSFLKDLKLTTDDFNLGNVLAKLGFLIAELPSQLISKKIGPDRWIPIQMCLWSIVGGSQFFLTGRSSFLATRFLVGLCQGGFIPDVILYLSYYFKKSEMNMRLALFFTANYSVNIVAGFLGIGLLKMDGIGGHQGWRWLFLIEGLLTFVVGFITFFNMPSCPTNTRTWFRPNGWFTEREEIIMTNRILRDDPGKGQMHNRQAISWRMFWDSVCDYDLWPIYAMGILFGIPQAPVSTYLTLAYHKLGFSTVDTNLLSIPNYALAIIVLILLATSSDYFNERGWHACTQCLWNLPCLIVLYHLPGDRPWAYFATTTVLLGAPYVHAILVSWVSMNAGSVRTRTVGSSLYNMCAQISGIASSYIYRPNDAPLYRRGNRILIGICVMNLVLFPLVKLYYIKRNQYKKKVWEALSKKEQSDYLETTEERGSKRLDFQFFH